MESTLPPAPHSRSAGAKTPESPKNPLQLGCSVTQIRHFFKRTFFNLPLIFENNVKKATVWLHERDEIYRFCKASPFGRGVTAGDGEGKDGTIGPLHSDKQALCQREAIAAFVPLCPRPCPLRRFAPALPKGEPLIHPLYLLCARPSLPSMMSLAAASRSGRRSARALASSGGNLPSTQSARS